MMIKPNRSGAVKSSAVRWLMLCLVLSACLLVGGCRPSVGVGMSVGVPVGDYGHISIGVGGGRWF